MYFSDKAKQCCWQPQRYHNLPNFTPQWQPQQGSGRDKILEPLPFLPKYGPYCVANALSGVIWGLKPEFFPSPAYIAASLDDQSSLPRALDWALTEGHLVQAIAIDGYREARDAMAADYAIMGGTQTLFNNQRDKYGFCLAEDRLNHAFHVRGITDNHKRPGILVATPFGPPFAKEVMLPHGVRTTIPTGSFLVDASAFTPTELWAVK